MKSNISLKILTNLYNCMLKWQTPFRKLPTKILLIIFKYYFLSDLAWRTIKTIKQMVIFSITLENAL